MDYKTQANYLLVSCYDYIAATKKKGFWSDFYQLLNFDKVVKQAKMCAAICAKALSVNSIYDELYWENVIEHINRK